jgi:hypothetical protein
VDDDRAVERDAAFLDHTFDVTPRANTGAREQLGDALRPILALGLGGFGFERGGDSARGAATTRTILGRVAIARGFGR